MTGQRGLVARLFHHDSPLGRAFRPADQGAGGSIANPYRLPTWLSRSRSGGAAGAGGSAGAAAGSPISAKMTRLMPMRWRADERQRRDDAVQQREPPAGLLAGQLCRKQVPQKPAMRIPPSVPVGKPHVTSAARLRTRTIPGLREENCAAAHGSGRSAIHGKGAIHQGPHSMMMTGESYCRARLPCSQRRTQARNRRSFFGTSSGPFRREIGVRTFRTR